jgi:hypothetical protein
MYAKNRKHQSKLEYLRLLSNCKLRCGCQGSKKKIFSNRLLAYSQYDSKIIRFFNISITRIKMVSCLAVIAMQRTTNLSIIFSHFADI